GLNQGFDLYDDNYGKGPARLNFSMQERSAAAVLEAGSQWWRANEGKKRFMWVHLYDPHAPYRPPEPFAAEYGRDRYRGEVAYVDHALAGMVGPLLTPDTLIIVTSDHGEGLGEHSEATHGLFAYEPTLKVPLLVAGAGVPQRREPQYVRHIDIAPTILSVAGTPPPAALPGKSLLESIGSRDTYFESLSASLNRGWAPLTGVITRGQKYIDLPIPELYDLSSDPEEKTNRRAEKRREVEAARRLLASLTAGTTTSQRTMDAEEIARLRSLGYVSGNAKQKTTYTEADDPKNLIDVNTKMNQIVESYENGDLQGALLIARQVVADHPEMDAGRELLAFVLQEAGDVSGAVEQLRAVLAQGRGSDDLKAQIALLLCELGRSKEAVQLLSGIADSGNPDVINAYGVALADSARPAEAVRQFERLLARDPNNAPALQNLGVVMLRQNDVTRARHYLTRAVELNPRLPLAWNTLGVVHARTDDFAGAMAAWKRAIAVDPRQFDTLFNLGMVAARVGQKEEAARALQRFIATAPPRQYAPDIATAQRVLASVQ
ncbi:MAG TPA: tetratricopeptide repeat protein, partial [Thermoanaerobaculia bacterium]|nr:tetratricopeptide repeat protein [Thermoanaerobaculia bacterium]